MNRNQAEMMVQYQEPGAFLALWNDIEEARIQEYERWHTLEHVPERVWVPSFISGTRYVALSGNFSRYFTLYEMASLSCLSSPSYDELVQRPTPWSASMRPSFRNFLRKTCILHSDTGCGKGAGVLVVRAVWSPSTEPSGESLDLFSSLLLRRGAEFCAMRVQTGKVHHAGPQALANVDAAPQGMEYIFIVHTSRPQELEQLSRKAETVITEVFGPPAWKHDSCYQFSSVVTHDEVKGPIRPEARVDLMPTAL
jgi:hypothetical protein